MNYLLPVFALLLILTGCCTKITTAVRNDSGRDIYLTVVQPSQQPEIVRIRAASTGRCRGVLPSFAGQPADSWIITDGQSRFTFADVSPIATLPGSFVSSSRFTKVFPCNRVTRHVRLAPDMTIHAARVIGYTESEPAPFPIRYSTKEEKQ